MAWVQSLAWEIWQAAATDKKKKKKKKKKNTNELIYRTAINPQRYKTNLRLPKGKGLGRDKLGVWD